MTYNVFGAQSNPYTTQCVTSLVYNAAVKADIYYLFIKMNNSLCRNCQLFDKHTFSQNC